MSSISPGEHVAAIQPSLIRVMAALRKMAVVQGTYREEPLTGEEVEAGLVAAHEALEAAKAAAEAARLAEEQAAAGHRG